MEHFAADRRNPKMLSSHHSVNVVVSSDDQLRKSAHARKKTRQPVKRVHTVTNVTEDAEKVLKLIVKLNRSRSQNDAAPQVENRTWYVGGTLLNPRAQADNNYVFMTANSKPTSLGYRDRNSRRADDEASTPYEHIDYEKMLPAGRDPNALYAEDLEFDGGASSDGPRGSTSEGVNLRDSGDYRTRESSAWGDSLNSNRIVSSSTALSRSSSDHVRKSRVSQGIGQSDNSPLASGSEDRLSDGAMAAVASRKKKSIFQRAKERIQAGFRRIQGKDSEKATAERSSGSRHAGNHSSTASGRGLQRMNSSTPSMETRSENGTSSSLVRRKSSKSTTDQRESKVGFLSRIPQRFGSMRTKSQKSKNAPDTSVAAPRWPRSAENVGIPPLSERDRKLLETYRPAPTQHASGHNPPRHISSPYSHAATGFGAAAEPTGDYRDSAQTFAYDRTNHHRHSGQRIEGRRAAGGWVAPDPPTSFRTTTHHRTAGEGVRLASSEDCSTPPNSSGDSLDGGGEDIVRMKHGSTTDLSIDGNPGGISSTEYIRPVFERSLAEQEEAFGHVASRLSEIAEEVMKKYSFGGDGSVCMASVREAARTEAENTATASSATGAEGGASVNYLHRLLGSSMAFHDVVHLVSRATSNEPIVMQIALLFGLTSEAIRLVGEATPMATEITRQAMEYFETQLASDVVQVGGLESIVEQMSEEPVYEYETSV